MTSIIYIILAMLGLGFLVFIHELGHYFMARRVGMKVQIFSIGFGRPIFSWKVNDELWQIGWIPFGGYVKILGMDPGSEEEDSHKEGFFAKSPWDRIKVAFMGPLVNIVFAFLAFSLLYAMGGREKNFTEYTPQIGWVDPKSELYEFGVRPGDEIVSYDYIPFTSARDHLYAAIISDGTVTVQGNHVDYTTGLKKPFDVEVHSYPHPRSPLGDVKTLGILSSANYLVYRDQPELPLDPNSPMAKSGIQSNDRIVWVDGVRVFSLEQLTHLLNDHRALLTIERGGKRFLARVPRVAIDNFKVSNQVKEEFNDWQHAAHLQDEKLGKLYVIPYDLTASAVVEDRLKFIDVDTQAEIFAPTESPVDQPLQPGDKIVAIDGKAVTQSYELFAQLQKKEVRIIVKRNPVALDLVTWTEANSEFVHDVNEKDLEAIENAIATGNNLANSGDLYLLSGVTPVKRADLVLTPDRQIILATELKEEKTRIDQIENSEVRAAAQAAVEERNNQLILGLPVQDRHVKYNPSPTEQFYIVAEEIWRTLSSLVSGVFSPKFLSGPVGIVHMVQESWGVSIKEVIYWLGAISLNLGMLNLLPIPVLDGGYICIFLLEMITGKPMSKKTLQRLIIPFVVLLVGLLFYVTYNDISRLFGGFFS